MTEYDCFLCNEKDYKNEINLTRHLEKEHEYKTLLAYIRLRKKIEDRIKELEQDDWEVHDKLSVLRGLLK